MQLTLTISKEIKRNLDLRADADTFLGRIELLTGRDRAMMTMYFRHGASFRQIARLTGLHEATIARRIHKISARLNDARYTTCLRYRDFFTTRELEIAKEIFIRGKSIRTLTRQNLTTYHKTRQTVKRIESILDLLKGR